MRGAAAPRRSFLRFIRQKQKRSGVLFQAQIALVVEPFLARATLVVFAVWRRVRRYAVLSGWIGCSRRSNGAAAGARIALRVARRAAQCGVSHGRLPLEKAAAGTGGIPTV
jgi:hypothetical protein